MLRVLLLGNVMANPYAIDFGSIPFSSAPGTMFGALGGSPASAMAALGPAYQSSYNAALDFNKQLGGTINSGYNRAMEQQLAAQQGILGGIEGYGGSARADITAANAKQQADAMQSMISRGLGNTTVLDSAKRGLNDDLARQNLQLDDQLAAMRANYQTGFARDNTGLALSQLGFLNSMSGQYPNAGLYGQLAGQFGAANQSAANQAAVQDQLRRAQSAAGGGAVMGAIGGGGGGKRQSAFGPAYSGISPTGYYGPQATGGGVGVGAGAYGSPGGFSTGYDGGGLFGGIADWASGLDYSSQFEPLAPVGGDLPWYDPWGMAGGGGEGNSWYDPFGVADGGYDSGGGLFGGVADWAGAAAGGGYDWGDDGYLYADWGY